MSGPQSLSKQPSESRHYTMDFAANMVATESISAVVSVTASPTGLTIGTTTFSGKKVVAKLSGGTNGVAYKVTFVVTTDAGQTLESEGILNVGDS